MDADALIKAVTDAIANEQNKSGVSMADAEKKQAEDEQKRLERIAQKEEEARSQKMLDDAVGGIIEYITANRSDMNKIKPILDKCKEMGYANPKEITSIEDAQTILAMTLK